MTGHHPEGAGTSPGVTGTPAQDNLYDFTEVVPFADLPASEPAAGQAAHVPPHQAAAAPAQSQRTQAAPEPGRTPRAAAASASGIGSNDAPSRAPRPARPQSRDIQPAAQPRTKQDSNTTGLVLIAAICVVLLVIVVLAILILTRVVSFPGL